MRTAALIFLLVLGTLTWAHALRINEFLADNTSTTLADEDLDTPDWIELYNPSGTPVSLAGRYLTDDAGDLAKWPCPAVSIPGQGYLVIFASGKDRAPVNGDPLHTNFVLAPSGEYVALVDTDGATVLSEFGSAESAYPSQRAGVSYGYFGEPLQVGFMVHPTPNELNDGNMAVLGFVQDTKFDIDRGFFSAPINVAIESGTPGALIRYTTDGSWPSETNGIPYTGPVLVDRTLPLKAIAFKPGFVSSNIDTHTYVFVNNVVTQTADNTNSVWGLPSSWDGNSPYYGMNRNPRVDPYSASVLDGLKEEPTLSIAMETDDLFGSSGIYSHPLNSGAEWERRTSLEFIDPDHPDGSNDFQLNCAIQIHGGAFRAFRLTSKKSFRVTFKSEYGAGNLPTGGPGRLDFPLFGPDAASEFQTLVFRMESNDGWQWAGAGSQPQYARDEFGRRAQLALGQPAAHGRYCHLYLNGVYWGVYNLTERPDSGFAESYFGAPRETWQGQNSGSPINDATNLDDWHAMLEEVDDISGAGGDLARDREYLEACGFNADGSRNESRPAWIDPTNFADYLLVNWYVDNNDWPHRNYYCGRARDPGSTGFKFFMWDAEWSLLLRSRVDGNPLGNFDGVAEPQEHLEWSPEYRIRFADRAHRALFNDGVFTRARATGLYNEITSQHLSILNPEAARWGNQHGDSHDIWDWRNESLRLLQGESSWFAQRGSILVNLLRGRHLYPDTDAPSYSPHGGSVPVGGGPTLSVPDDITRIYYIHGPGDAYPDDYGHSLDPRLVGGGINPAASLIDFGAPGDGLGFNTSAPLSFTESGFLFSRSYNTKSGEWSALNTALFTTDTVPADAANLVVSEIHYHPEAATPDERAAGHDDQDLFEFLEVQNISEGNVDLSQVDFIDGIEFGFAPGFTLGAGARAVIVKDRDAFNFRYAGFPASRIAGSFQGGTNLSNSGERIAIRAADGSIIKSFAYDDEGDWPTAPDGVTGVSLVLMNPAANPDHAIAGNWRSSAAVGGNPGDGDALHFTGFVGDDRDGDGLPAFVEHAAGTSDGDGMDGNILTVATQIIEVGGALDEYFTMSFPRELRAEDVEIIPEATTGIADWNAGSVALVFVSEVPLDGTRTLVTYRSSIPLESLEQLFVRFLVQAR